MPYPDFLLNFIMLCSIHVPRRPGSPRAALGLCIVGSGRGTSSRSRCSSKSWTTISTRGCGSTLIESVQGLRHDLGVHYRVRGGVCSREFGRVRSRACYRVRCWDLGRVGGRLASRRCGGVRRRVGSGVGGGRLRRRARHAAADPSTLRYVVIFTAQTVVEDILAHANVCRARAAAHGRRRWRWSLSVGLLHLLHGHGQQPGRRYRRREPRQPRRTPAVWHRAGSQRRREPPQ